MGKLLTLIAVLFCMPAVYAQIERYTPRMLGNSNLPEENKSEDVQRNFVSQIWRKGTVYFSAQSNPVVVPLLFDAYSNRLYYQQNGAIMEFNERVKEFKIAIVKKDTMDIVFRNAYPVIHKNTGETFYEVLVDGRFQLLKCRAKTIGLYKDQEIPEEERIDTKELLYALLPNNTIIAVKKDKDDLLKEMPGYANAIQQICSNGKLKLKNEAQLKELFIALNK